MRITFLAFVLCLSTLSISNSQISKVLNAVEAPQHSMNTQELQLMKEYSDSKRWEVFLEGQQSMLEDIGPSFTPEWTNLGPNSLDTLSGRMVCLTFHPHNPQILFAGSGTGGLWKSENGGASWVALTDELPSMRVSAVALNPSNPDEILIGTGIGQVTTSSLQPGIGVLKSSDGGMTWETTSFSFNTSAVVSTYKLVYDPFVPDKVYLAATNGFYISMDGGENWTATNTSRVYDIELHPSEEGTIFIGTRSIGVQKSTNGGMSWTTLNNGIASGSQVARVDVAICNGTPNTLVARLISASNFSTIGLYKTVDGGNNWAVIANAPDVACQPTNPNSCVGWLFHTVGIAPDDPDKIFMGGVQFWYTHDGGDNWVWKDYASNGSGNNLGNANLVYVDHWDIDFDPENMGRLYVCCDGGVIRSDDYGVTWTRMTTDLINAMCYTIATHPDNPNFMIGGFHDHGLQRLINENGNLTWTRWSNNDGINTLIDPVNDGVVYGNIQNGGIIKSFSNGSGTTSSFWTNLGIQESGPWDSPLVMNLQMPNILYTATSSRIYKTSNGANSWSVAANIPNVNTLAIDLHDSKIVYAHSFSAGGWGFYRSEDEGNSWIEINSNSIPGWGTTAITSDPHQSGRIYATRNSTNANSDHIKVSNDNGTSWVDITNDFPDIRVHDILVSPYNENYLFLATDLGVYFSENKGDNWCAFNNNLPRIFTMDLNMSVADSTLRVATFGRGIWKTSLKTLNDSTTKTTESVKNKVIFEAYPNPAKESFRLKIVTESRQKMSANLYDQQGRRIQHVFQSEGTVDQFDETVQLKKSITPGIYYLKIRVGNYQYHRKLMVVE